jgi:SAM-dependent methyltransferase
MLLEYAPLIPCSRVLDIGCGTGFPLLELAQRLGQGCTVVGLDPWKAAMDRIRQKAAAWHVPNIQLVEGDAAEMPFDDASFDLIVSNLGINNLSRPESALAECRRVLKDQGTVALTTNSCGHMAQFYRALEVVLREMKAEQCLERLEQHVRHRRSIPELIGLLAAAGFDVRRVERRDLPMRFLNGSALLRHSFIRLAFLDGWRGIVECEQERETFRRLEQELNRHADANHGLELTVPMAYIEARKTD